MYNSGALVSGAGVTGMAAAQLPVTGTKSGLLAVVGFTIIICGLLMMRAARIAAARASDDNAT